MFGFLFFFNRIPDKSRTFEEFLIFFRIRTTKDSL